MTKKLFYQNPNLQHFSAEIIRQEADYVVLSETAFYPTGGGQPHDTGYLNAVEVVGVELVDDEIRHYLSKPLISSKVEGKLNWDRRFDHMQQHCGQHILSAAFDELYHYKTVSFHLGKDNVTIDLDTENITLEQLASVEKLANQIILENRPIETKWVTEEELASYPLRKPTKVKEDIRLVIIPDYDYNACGGTHPTSTGQVGQLTIVRTEKQKKYTRVEFLCGHRIIEHFSRKELVLNDLISTLSSPESQLVESVRTLLNSNKQLERKLNEIQEKLLSYEAKEFSEQLKDTIVTANYQNRSIHSLQKLAKLVVEQNPQLVCFLASENEEKLQIVGARGTERAENMNEIIKTLLATIKGRGGGNASFAQGGGECTITGEELIHQAISLISVT